MAELRISYSPDDEWIGELHVAVESGGFAGHGTDWINRDDVLEGFLPTLRAFPISADAPPLIEGSFYGQRNSGTSTKGHVRILIMPQDSRGTLAVHVDLRALCYERDVMRNQSVVAQLLCDYASVAQFALELERVMKGSLDQAVLRSTNS